MGVVTMSVKECRQLEVVQLVANQVWTPARGAQELGITTRQLRRLCKRLRDEGVKGMVHRSRGRPSKRRISDEIRLKVLALVREKYYDFGPTLLSERLVEVEGIKCSSEWCRNLLLENGLRKKRDRKNKKVYYRRQRRPQEGELEQADGSYHKWFEDRAAKCCLLVFIDDATGKLQVLLFVKHESTEAYFEAFRIYLERYGKPRALYTDKHSVFKVTKGGDNLTDENVSQFQRAMKELQIELIHANSPQAKGRVERANGTLQDRLVKFMRLKGASSIEEGNQALEEFRVDYNKRFARTPEEAENGHRPLGAVDLDRILVQRETRKVQKDLSVSYQGKTLHVKTKTPRRLAGQAVSVYTLPDGSLKLEHQGSRLEYTLFTDGRKQKTVMDSKELTATLDHKPRLTRIERVRRGIGCPR